MRTLRDYLVEHPNNRLSLSEHPVAVFQNLQEGGFPNYYALISRSFSDSQYLLVLPLCTLHMPALSDQTLFFRFSREPKPKEGPNGMAHLDEHHNDPLAAAYNSYTLVPRVIEVVSEAVARYIKTYHFFGVVGGHRGVFLSSRNQVDHLSALVDRVAHQCHELNCGSFEICPLDRTGSDCERRIHEKGWRGTVEVDVDGFYLFPGHFADAGDVKQ
jgi:hypothetical protein